MIPLFDIPEIVQHYAPHFAEVFSEEAFLHYSDDQTDYPVDFRLWQPADLARIEAGLRAAACRCAKASWRSSKMTPRSGGSTWWGSGDASRTDRRSSVSTRAS